MDKAILYLLKVKTESVYSVHPPAFVKSSPIYTNLSYIHCHLATFFLIMRLPKKLPINDKYSSDMCISMPI